MRQCSGPQDLLVQMQTKLPLSSPAGSHTRLSIERLSLGRRNSLSPVPQHCFVMAPLAAASHDFLLF